MMHFCVERYTDLRKRYPVVRGELQKFDALPSRYRGGVDRSDAPMDRRRHRLPANAGRRLSGQVRRGKQCRRQSRQPTVPWDEFPGRPCSKDA